MSGKPRSGGRPGPWPGRRGRARIAGKRARGFPLPDLLAGGFWNRLNLFAFFDFAVKYS
jgi:hypothetical protein